MSYEKFGGAYTADDLYEFLRTIPSEIRKVLPIQLIVDEHGTNGGTVVNVTAYEVRETEGCLERGLQMTQESQ